MKKTGLGAGTLAKPLPAVLVYPTGARVCDLAAPLLVQLSANVPEKVEDDGSSTWTPGPLQAEGNTGSLLQISSHPVFVASWGMN